MGDPKSKEETGCIFCKIGKGEAPCYKLYEDEDYMAFLDINPVVEGHSLLIPKKHARWVYDVSDFGEYFSKAKDIGITLQNKLEADFISFITYGMDVPHAHIQILPRKNEDRGGIFPERIEIDKESLSKILNKILDQ